jgi:hypothetical protein
MRRFALGLIVGTAAMFLGWGAVGAASADAEILTAGNGIYNVFVDNETGQYTVTTGPSHPLGEGLNVLFGDGEPGTSFDSIKSYTSGETYVLQNAPQSTVPLGATGFRTTYTISGVDELTVVQDVQVLGTTFFDSRVEVSTVVTNNGASSMKLGIRYLWDYQIGKDDGPTFQQNEPNGPVLFTEQAFPSPSFDHYTIEDNNENPTPPTFDVLGTVTGPPSANAVTPTLLQNASWPASEGTEFEYTPTGQDVSSGGGIDDNAVLYYWGDKESDAPELAPGGAYRASASMFLTRPGEGVPKAPPPPPAPAPAPTPPVVTITSGPPHESAQSSGKFTFVGVAGGSFECSVDGGRFKPCSSGHDFGPFAPGDHLFQVRETLHGLTGPVASYKWTVDLPRKCVLRVARARVFVFTKHDKVRLVIHYTSYRPAQVTVGYELKGAKGPSRLGSATDKFKKAGVFRLPETLSDAEMAKVRAAKSFEVSFAIPKTPQSCGRYYTKHLTIKQPISNQTVWFQSDSRFAP